MIAEISTPTQVEITAMPVIGAAVASMMKANFAREILNLSISGRMMGPTIRAFA